MSNHIWIALDHWLYELERWAGRTRVKVAARHLVNDPDFMSDER